MNIPDYGYDKDTNEYIELMGLYTEVFHDLTDEELNEL